jgi:hypothetical protein
MIHDEFLIISWCMLVKYEENDNDSPWMTFRELSDQDTSELRQYGRNREGYMAQKTKLGRPWYEGLGEGVLC